MNSDISAKSALSLVIVSELWWMICSQIANRNLVTRVKCSNCQQMGHYKSKCPNPLVDEDAAAGFDNAGFDNAGFDNGGFDNQAGGGDWESSAVAAGGDW